MNHLDLFSGIGGFSLGLERAGFNTVAFCEIEDYPRKILTKHWPTIPIYRDVRDVTKNRLVTDGIITDNKKIDIITGGFPCQPFSVIGKQEGKEDNRHLWPQMLRIIRETKPDWIIGENVIGFIAMALDDVLFDLESEGYAAQPFIIPACAVGGEHRRDRVWIIANAQRKRLEGLTRYVKNKGEGAAPVGSVTPQSIPRDWEPIGQSVEPSIRLRGDGLPDHVARLKALGNAVVPQIPEIIGRAIYEFLPRQRV